MTEKSNLEGLTPQALVEQSYDTIATTYNTWTTAGPSPRTTYLTKLLALLPRDTPVLELGCGAGLPVTKLLAEHSAHVTGNDISEKQVELARENVKGAKFVHGDMTKLKFAEKEFGAVVAMYSVIHLPRGEQEGMLKMIAGWLSDGGYLLLNLGTVDNEGSVNDNWLGAKMYWSGFDADTNRKMVARAGFTLLEANVVDDDEDGRIVPFLWILARKGVSGTNDE